MTTEKKGNEMTPIPNVCPVCKKTDMVVHPKRRVCICTSCATLFTYDAKTKTVGNEVPYFRKEDES